MARDSILKLIHEDLDRLQYSPTSRFLLFQPLPIGLGGQIVGRIDALLLALALNRKAIFPSNDDPPYTQSFTAQCDYLPAHIPARIETLNLSLDQSTKPFVRYSPNDFFVRVAPKYTLILNWIASRLRIPPQSCLFFDGVILDWMKYSAKLDADISDTIIRLGVSKDTLGVHLRRGDKTVEAPYVPAHLVNEKIAELCKKFDYTTVFLASDSPKAPQEIDLPHNVRLIFDETEIRYNNANHKMLLRNAVLAEQETFTACKNLELLASCGGIIGQTNAHFAKLAASKIFIRDHTDRAIFLIDGRIAEELSPVTKVRFVIWRRFRAFARRLLPFLTMEKRVRRNKRKI